MEEPSMLRNCAGSSLDIFAQFMKICDILHYITEFAEFDILSQEVLCQYCMGTYMDDI